MNLLFKCKKPSLTPFFLFKQPPSHIFSVASDLLRKWPILPSSPFPSSLSGQHHQPVTCPFPRTLSAPSPLPTTLPGLLQLDLTDTSTLRSLWEQSFLSCGDTLFSCFGLFFNFPFVLPPFSSLPYRICQNFVLCSPDVSLCTVCPTFFFPLYKNIVLKFGDPSKSSGRMIRIDC